MDLRPIDVGCGLPGLAPGGKDLNCPLSTRGILKSTLPRYNKIRCDKRFIVPDGLFRMCQLERILRVNRFSATETAIGLNYLACCCDAWEKAKRSTEDLLETVTFWLLEDELMRFGVQSRRSRFRTRLLYERVLKTPKTDRHSIMAYRYQPVQTCKLCDVCSSCRSHICDRTRMSMFRAILKKHWYTPEEINEIVAFLSDYPRQWTFAQRSTEVLLLIANYVTSVDITWRRDRFPRRSFRALCKSTKRSACTCQCADLKDYSTKFRQRPRRSPTD